MRAYAQHWLLVVLVALLVVGLDSGCTSLESMSTTYTGCSEDEITISDHQGGWSGRRWVASCRGRRFQCGGGDPGIWCTQAPRTAGGSSFAPPGFPYGVSRGRTNDGRFAALRAFFNAEPVGLGFIAAPRADPRNAVMVVHAPRQSPAGCQVAVMADGQLTRLQTLNETTTDQWREIHLAIPVQTMSAMAQGQRVVGRICDAEFRVGQDGKAILRELLARFAEELRFGG